MGSYYGYLSRAIGCRAEPEVTEAVSAVFGKTISPYRRSRPDINAALEGLLRESAESSEWTFDGAPFLLTHGT